MGSIGIALAATLLTHGEATYHAVLAEDASGPVARDWLRHATSSMQALGADPGTAQQRALGILNLKVSQQATVLAYNHIFVLVALLFVIVTPLVFLLRSAGHVEGVEIMAD
jgi:DHA2 family multidrug resistance protein